MIAAEDKPDPTIAKKLAAYEEESFDSDDYPMDCDEEPDSDFDLSGV